MDPNATLTDIREIVAAYEAGAYTHDSDKANALDELTSKVQALDEWLTDRGFPPDEWAHNR